MGAIIGGLAGIVLGVAFSRRITAVAGWRTPVSLVAITGGLLFSAAVGIFFGYYPARRAARRDPIGALLYERSCPVLVSR
jgi:macrolide transport system ATP-binding/permease protein